MITLRFIWNSRNVFWSSWSINVSGSYSEHSDTCNCWVNSLIKYYLILSDLIVSLLPPQVLPYLGSPCWLLCVSPSAASVLPGVPLQPGPDQGPTPGRTGARVPLWGRWYHRTHTHTHTPESNTVVLPVYALHNSSFITVTETPTMVSVVPQKQFKNNLMKLGLTKLMEPIT